MRRALLVAALALAVAGCADDGETASTASTPAPTATATDTPEPEVTGDPLAPPPAETTKTETTTQIATGTGDDLRFTNDYVNVEADTLTFEMINASGTLEHAIALRGKGVNVQGRLVGKGGVSRIEIALKPGTYEFYCPVSGHRAGGMKGRLVIR